jgi:ferritin
VNNKVRDALTAQIGRELQAEHIYLAMSIWFAGQDLDGFAGWLRTQAAEEREHAYKILDHLLDRDAHVELGGLDQPPGDFGTPLGAIQTALEHEKKVTGHIHDLYELARKEGDHPAEIMLQWFVDEQVEEEKTFGTLVRQIERVGEGGTGLMVLDRHLGERAG